MKICMTGNTISFGEGHAYNGERLIGYLAEALTDRGHDVYLFAKAGTRVKKVKDYIPTPGLNDHLDTHYEAVKEYQKKTGIEFDVYQCNYFGTGWNPELIERYNYCELTWCTWCHLGHQMGRTPFNTIAYSKTLQNDFKNVGMNTIKIHHGLPKDLYQFNAKPQNYAVWIGKVEGGKYPEAAIKIAKAAGMKIIMMGPPYNTGCFWNQIAPYIDNETVFWVRGVDDTVKNEIMRNAKVFLYTNDNSWKEHFGLVMTEAMACGTPIIAMNRPNDPCSAVQDDLVLDGKTGFILNYDNSNNFEAILDKGVELLSRIDEIDRQACRKHFDANFTVDLMAQRYEYLYGRIQNGKRFSLLQIP